MPGGDEGVGDAAAGVAAATGAACSLQPSLSVLLLSRDLLLTEFIACRVGCYLANPIPAPG